MPFESLAFRYNFHFDDLPSRWLPLIHLYDPDLPLFPIYYFHVLDPDLQQGARPTDTQRAYGYIERINIADNGDVQVVTVLNKNLDDHRNVSFRAAVMEAVRNRLGLANPVTLDDVTDVFSGEFANRNRVMEELWHRVVADAYGNKLPFGRLWDEVYGLVRYVSSWYSTGGRKGELIQTHYFLSKFGERIQTSQGIPPVDFYLLPTLSELRDRRNALTTFSAFSKLVSFACNFTHGFTELREVKDGISLSAFLNPSRQLTGRANFDTDAFLGIVNSGDFSREEVPHAIECFNSFDKGPGRTVLFLLMLSDLREERLYPELFDSAFCGALYRNLGSTYQSPKALEIYAQQCFGNVNAIPVDTWIKTFFKWPLNVMPATGSSYRKIFELSQGLGKMERLLWVAGQARKVHSSACNDCLWCLKYASNGAPRGANPLSCNICLQNIRENCPAFNAIRARRVFFNRLPLLARDAFVIETSAADSQTPNQKFVSCKGYSLYEEIQDDFSPEDAPNGFGAFPVNIDQEDFTVGQFVQSF